MLLGIEDQIQVFANEYKMKKGVPKKLKKKFILLDDHINDYSERIFKKLIDNVEIKKN